MLVNLSHYAVQSIEKDVLFFGWTNRVPFESLLTQSTKISNYLKHRQTLLKISTESQETPKATPIRFSLLNKIEKQN